MTDSSSTTDRPIGLTGATATVIASMIGVGIFVSPGYTLKAVGAPWLATTAWAVGGVIAICGAIAYGALAQRLVESGGEYLYLSRRVHPWAGMVAGWTSLLAGFAGPTAAAALALEEYLSSTGQPATVYSPFSATACVLIFCCWHLPNTKLGANTQTAIVAWKIVLLAGLGLLLCWAHATDVATITPPSGVMPPELASRFRPIFSEVPVSLMWISLTYTGFNAAIYFASDVRQPKQTVPRAMILGTTITAFLYLGLVSLLYWRSWTWLYASWHGANFFNSFFVFNSFQLPGWVSGFSYVRIVAGVCLVTSISAMMLTGPRVLSRMACDGMMPRSFIAAEGKPPRRAILAQTFVAIVLLFSTSLIQLLTHLGMTLSLCSAASVATLFFFRDDRPRVGVLIAAGIYVTATTTFAGLACWVNPANGLGVVFILVIATIAYVWFRKRPETTTSPDPAIETT